LAATKTINDVAFDGSANITVTADATTLTGTSLKSTVVGSSLTSVGTLTDLTVTNPISGSITGNAATSTKLAATKTINDVAFDGSANITVTADATTLTGTSLKNTVVGSSLTSVGTLTGLTVTNPIVGSILGNAGNVSGTVAVGNGGTGAQNAGDALSNLGAQSTANLSTDIATDAASTTKYPAVKTIRDYVIAQVASGAPDADGTTKGKIQLAGDLSGSAASPSIATGAITSAKIADGAIVNDDISSTAAIADSKLATIATAGKVDNSATTATNSNTASAIVARDASGDFSARNISAVLLGNASTATKLAATKTINNVAFDGSSNITVTADAGTLSGTTLKSTVVSSSLTSVGTLTDLTVTNDLTVNGLTIGRGAGSPNNAENTALGIGTLKVNSAAGTSTQGVSNTAVGFNSLIANTFGSSLTALGHSSLLKNITGSNNVALGQAAMYNNTSGSNNVAIGNASLYTNTTYFGNTAIGKSAGQYLNNENNTVIGAYSDLNDPTFKNATAIGYGARVKASNTIQLGADGATLNGGTITTTAITNVRTSGTLTLGLVTYPNSHGTSGQILSTTGTGDLSWITPSTFATSFSGNLSGDVTGGQGSTVVAQINGVSLKDLSSGLLKNTTTTGVPSIATAGSDYSAGTSGLVSGILKSTTSTGALSIAAVTDFPTLNQNTTGNASTATTAGNITATSNSTLTSISTLSAVGTITSGTWSATAIGTSKGGTGLTSFSNGGAVYASSTSVLTTGTLPVASGGTGAATATPNYIFAGPQSGSTAAAPGFRAMVALDIPNEAISYARMQKITSGKLLGSINAASAVPGEVTIGTGLSLTGGTLAATSTGTVTNVAALTFGTTGTDVNSSVTNSTSTPVITLNIPNASATARGVVSTEAQTIAGAKTFSGNVKALNYITTVPGTNTTAAATTALDFSTGNILKVSLVTNITTLNISNAQPGTYIVEFIQDLTGGRTVSFSGGNTNAWKWSGGTAPTITATSGKTDIITIVYDGSTYFASAVQNF
jgi:hypothetical protein